MQQCVRQAGCLWASLEAVTICIAVLVVGLVKLSQSHELGVLNTAPLSFQQLAPALGGPHKQWHKQTFLVFFHRHFSDFQKTLCHCPTLRAWDRWDWKVSNHLLWLCPKMKRWMVPEACRTPLRVIHGYSLESSRLTEARSNPICYSNRSICFMGCFNI